MDEPYTISIKLSITLIAFLRVINFRAYGDNFEWARKIKSLLSRGSQKIEEGRHPLAMRMETWLPNRPESNWGAASHTKKQRNRTFPETELPNGSGDYGPPDVPRGPPGARSPRWAPQLEATLAFPPFWRSWQKKARPWKGDGVAGPWHSGQDWLGSVLGSTSSHHHPWSVQSSWDQCRFLAKSNGAKVT